MAATSTSQRSCAALASPITALDAATPKAPRPRSKPTLMDTENQLPPICDYEGSDYQTRVWAQGGRAHEDGAEEIALRRLLPKHGKLMLEVGAGAGRNTP